MLLKHQIWHRTVKEILFELPGDSIEGLKLKRRECRTVAVPPQHHSIALFQGFKKGMKISQWMVERAIPFLSKW